MCINGRYDISSGLLTTPNGNQVQCPASNDKRRKNSQSYRCPTSRCSTNSCRKKHAYNSIAAQTLKTTEWNRSSSIIWDLLDLIMVADSCKCAPNAETCCKSCKRSCKRETLEIHKTQWKCTEPLGPPNQALQQARFLFQPREQLIALNWVRWRWKM